MTEEQKQSDLNPEETINPPESSSDPATTDVEMETDVIETTSALEGDSDQEDLASSDEDPGFTDDNDGEFMEQQEEEEDELIVALQQEIAAVNERLIEQTKETDNFKSQYARLAADFDNFRKRNEKQKEELELQVKRNTINELLAAIDSFERARSHIKPEDDGEMVIHKSYQGVYKQLVEGLKKIGVSAMRPEGHPFDPNLHEAVMREATNEYDEDIVIEQLVRGYMLNDTVLRHAMVKVAAPSEDLATDDEPEGIDPSQPE
jgi:molecular chaperone GrpE